MRREGQSKLLAVPITLRKANAFVRAHHRNLGPARGCKFVVACEDESGRLRGVATVGRPTARKLDDGRTAQITRVATDGCPNACSFLIGLCRRLALIMGYRRVFDYTFPWESGVSLKAAGMLPLGVTEGGSWSRKARRRVDKHTEPKMKWGQK
jgi:hypothetical protein